MKPLSTLFENKSLWERLDALHCLLFNAGCVGDSLRIHPDSVTALSIEMAPKPRVGDVFNPPRVVGGVSYAGPFTIVEDPMGVIL